ncbi:zinc-finger homeodomain protein 2-like [Zingiber officinale]|uniref:zinc-finger homeodomain protein 2-like n=1 Tax=Zingiber officinale TaxID=94328 RepID=UPI001C4B89F3|nr:zinc-finger homeodomain protein 2-like [Zingiber officinale]
MEFRNQDGDLRLPLAAAAASSSSSLVYNPPPIRGSAFSKPPALAPPSAILSPKGGGGGGDGGLRNGSSPVVTEDISSFFGRPKVRETDQPAPGAGLPGYKVSEGGEMFGEEEEVAGKYKECLRNHAASVGGHVVDGCGEFMPNGGPSTPDALKCAACGCHRSFHRKDGDGADVHPYHLRQAPPPLLLPPPPLRLQRALGGVFPASSPTSRAVPVSSSGWMASATTESSSEERVVVGGGPGMDAKAMRKRFRTKFTAEQKEKMLAFADRIGWRFQRQDESLVEQFCSDAGIKRHVLKVWMHNNKHSIKKQQQHQHQQQPPSPQEQHQ